jgi:methyl-accepting chemotaxis protein
MKTTGETADLFGHFSGKAIEALALWTDASQKIVRELAALSATSAKEGVEFCGQMQASTLEAVKAGQAYWFRHQSDVPKWMGDPVGCFHANLLEAMQEGQKGVKVFQDSVQALVQTAEHIQAANDQATKEIQETCNNLAASVKGIYSPA